MSSEGSGPPPESLSRAEKEAIKAGRGTTGGTARAVQSLDERVASKMANDVRQVTSADSAKKALTRTEREALKAKRTSGTTSTTKGSLGGTTESKVRSDRASGALKDLTRAEKEATKSGGSAIDTIQALEQKVASKMAVGDFKKNQSATARANAIKELSRAEQEAIKKEGRGAETPATLQALDQKIASKVNSDDVGADGKTTLEKTTQRELPNMTEEDKRRMKSDEEDGLVITAQLVGDDMDEENRQKMEDLARERLLQEMEVVTAKAEEITEDNNGKSKRSLFIAGAVVAVLIVVLVGTLTTILGEKSTVTPPIALALQALTLEDSLQYPPPLNSSASERALQWMVLNSEAGDEEDELELVQRFVMASMWFLSTKPFTESIVDYCLWDEISCDEEGHVVNADFRARDLLGTVPPDLGLLTRLTELALQRNNRLEGTIPTQFGSLSKLHVFNMFETQVDGSLPSELGLLTQLTQLWLGGNRLSGPIPTELGMLMMLREIDLQENLFTGTIPTEVGNMTNLTSLSLPTNILQGTIPTELSALQKLEHVNLGRNDLTGSIPSEIALLATLKGLYLNGNKLSGTIPAKLGLLSRLESLYLYDNKLSGTIPGELGQLSGLESLLLRENNFSGTVPSQLGLIPELRVVLLDHNPQFNGPLPDQFLSLTSLVDLRLSNTSLSGPLSVLLANPDWSDSLRELQLSDTLFEPPFPENPSLSSLTSLHMDQMALNGAIPTSLSQLTLLNDLSLRNSGLTGTFPPSWGSLSNMEYFDISGNPITGTLPMELTSWNVAAEINLSGLNLTGEFVFCNAENYNQDLFVGDCDEIRCECCEVCCPGEAGVWKGKDICNAA